MVTQKEKLTELINNKFSSLNRDGSKIDKDGILSIIEVILDFVSTYGEIQTRIDENVKDLQQYVIDNTKYYTIAPDANKAQTLKGKLVIPTEL